MTDSTSRAEPLLKRCPFCGAEAYLNVIEPHTHSFRLGDWKMPDHTGSTVVECTECNAGLIADTTDAVVAEWNRRASPEQSSLADQSALQGEAVAEWVNMEQGFQALIPTGQFADCTLLFAHPSAREAALEKALRLANSALEESHDDVVDTLNSYVDHPAYAGKRRMIQRQIDDHCNAMNAARAALGDNQT